MWCYLDQHHRLKTLGLGLRVQEPEKKSHLQNFPHQISKTNIYIYGAETCDLLGLYLLSQLQDLGLDIGVYRNDGLALSKFSRKKNEDIKKKLCEIFKRNGPSITITTNLKDVEFLDVTLDLNLGTYKPFLKPNDKP